MRTNLEVYRVAHPEPDMWILYFPWPTNPLPMNGSRGGWRRHSKQVAAIRDQAVYTARSARIPALGRCRAQLTWWVTTNGVRDVDNLADLEKRLFDALVIAGIVADDKPELMEKPRGLIRKVSDSDGLLTDRGFTLTVTRLPEIDS